MNKTKLALTPLVVSWSVATSLSLAESLQEKRQTVNPACQRKGDSRKFSIEYTGKVSEIPAGAVKTEKSWSYQILISECA